MRKFRNIVMMFALILAVMLLWGCKDAPPTPETVALSSKVVQSTPKGAQVHSETGVTEEQLVAIDKGLTTAFTNGRASGWEDNGKAFNYSLYKIMIPTNPCTLSPESSTPSFLVRGDNYDGSVYDQYNSKGELPKSEQNGFDKYVKDGVGMLYASEMVISMNAFDSSPPTYSSFVVCPDMSVLSNGVNYGAEHAIIS